MYLKDSRSGYIDCTNFFFCSFICLCRHKSQHVLGECKGFRGFILEESKHNEDLPVQIQSASLCPSAPAQSNSCTMRAEDTFFALTAIAQGQHGCAWLLLP